MTNNGDNNLRFTVERNVNTLLSRFPDRLVLRSAGNKAELFILSLFLFSLGLFVTIQRKGVYGGIFLMVFGIAFFSLIIYQIIKGPPVITLDVDYICDSNIFIKRCYRWREIVNIKPLYNERGDSIFSRAPKEVGVVFSEIDKPNADVLITNTYGFTLQEFARLIIGWQERALQKSTVPKPPQQS